MEKMICVPLGSEFDIKCPTGQPRILISSHYDCPTFIRLSVVYLMLACLHASVSHNSHGTWVLNKGYCKTILVCEDAPALVLNTLNDFNHTHQHFVGTTVR